MWLNGRTQFYEHLHGTKHRRHERKTKKDEKINKKGRTEAGKNGKNGRNTKKLARQMSKEEKPNQVHATAKRNAAGNR